jgi:hypothetical protein
MYTINKRRGIALFFFFDKVLVFQLYTIIMISVYYFIGGL